MTTTVLFSNILVKKIERETVKNGLIIPASTQEQLIRCEIVSVGAEVKYAKLGDTVFMEAYRGSPLEIEGNKFLIIKEQDILAILKD